MTPVLRQPLQVSGRPAALHFGRLRLGRGWHVLWAWLALSLGMGLLTACGSAPSGNGKDIVTASDQTDRDRLSDTLMELASMYFARGEKATALDEVKKAIAAKPERAQGYNLRGLVYASMDEHRLAEESFQKAIQIDALDADSRHNYAWFLCQRRRFAEADAQFVSTQAVPNYLGASRTLLAQGVCQARSGKISDAERTLSHAYELDPANPTTAVNLSEVLYRQGEYERARFYIRRVNGQTEQASAQTLWLAIRIENRLGQLNLRNSLGNDLTNRFPKSPEALLYQKGRFDE